MKVKIGAEKKNNNEKLVKKMIILSIEILDCFDLQQNFYASLNENYRFEDQSYFLSLKN